MAAIKQKDSYYGVYYRRLAARRGAQRALVAVMHKITTAIWHILRHKIAHRDLGADYFVKRDPQRAMRRMTKEANALGLTIRFDPIGVQFLTLFGMSPQNFSATQLQVSSGLLDVGFI